MKTRDYIKNQIDGHARFIQSFKKDDAGLNTVYKRSGRVYTDLNMRVAISKDLGKRADAIIKRIKEEEFQPCSNCGSKAGTYSMGNMCKACHTET